jgi:phosphoglycerate dehydrogenase-like enzyme
MTIVSFEKLKKETEDSVLDELKCDYIYIDRADRTHIKNVNPDFLICRDFDVIPEIIDLCPTLKMIFILSVGVNRLPFEYLRTRNIAVYHVTGEICSNEISQYVMNAVLMDCYGSRHLFSNQFSGIWERGYAISSCIGKSVLIFGYGNIGAAIASACKANKMSVSATSLYYIDDDILDEWMPLEDAIKRAGQYDYVVNALPLTSETRHMYNADFFSDMSNTCFINIGRGDHVVESDIYTALTNGSLRYAVLDVFSTEPLPEDSPLWTLENITITPHISGRVVDFADKAVGFFIRDCKAFLAGETTRGIINLEQEF